MTWGMESAFADGIRFCSSVSGGTACSAGHGSLLVEKSSELFSKVERITLSLALRQTKLRVIDSISWHHSCWRITESEIAFEIGLFVDWLCSKTWLNWKWMGRWFSFFHQSIISKNYTIEGFLGVKHLKLEKQGNDEFQIHSSGNISYPDSSFSFFPFVVLSFCSTSSRFWSLLDSWIYKWTHILKSTVHELKFNESLQHADIRYCFLIIVSFLCGAGGLFCSSRIIICMLAVGLVSYKIRIVFCCLAGRSHFLGSVCSSLI